MEEAQPHDAVPSLQDVIAAAERLLREALLQGRPHGTAWEATQLYRAAEGSRFRTEATLAACLSEWHSFVRQLDEAAERGEHLNLDEVTALLIHRTYNRARRKKDRDDRVADQLRRANVRGSDGEFLPFDPAAPAIRSDTLKYLPEEIAFLLEKRGVRDRMVIELRYLGGFTPKEIVGRVRQACPAERISQSTITRVLDRFEDDLRPRVRPD